LSRHTGLVSSRASAADARIDVGGDLCPRCGGIASCRACVQRRSRAWKPEGKINLTDLDSRNVKTPRGWVQGYNAQVVTTADQIVIAAEVTVDSPDFGHLEPMVCAALSELDYAELTDTPEVVLADAGYWHQIQIQRLMGDDLQVLIPPDANKRKGERPGWQGGLYAFMRRVLATEQGANLYGRRQGMIEPVFAHTKFNRRCDRFLRRGRSACRSEWRLIHATHNLLKLYKHTFAAQLTA
jgi:hypothetical protein